MRHLRSEKFTHSHQFGGGLGNGDVKSDDENLTRNYIRLHKQAQHMKEHGILGHPGHVGDSSESYIVAAMTPNNYLSGWQLVMMALFITTGVLAVLFFRVVSDNKGNCYSTTYKKHTKKKKVDEWSDNEYNDTHDTFSRPPNNRRDHNYYNDTTKNTSSVSRQRRTSTVKDCGAAGGRTVMIPDSQSSLDYSNRRNRQRSHTKQPHRPDGLMGLGQEEYFDVGMSSTSTLPKKNMNMNVGLHHHQPVPIYLHSPGSFSFSSHSSGDNKNIPSGIGQTSNRNDRVLVPLSLGVVQRMQSPPSSFESCASSTHSPTSKHATNQKAYKGQDEYVSATSPLGLKRRHTKAIPKMNINMNATNTNIVQELEMTPTVNNINPNLNLNSNLNSNPIVVQNEPHYEKQYQIPFLPQLDLLPLPVQAQSHTPTNPSTMEELRLVSSVSSSVDWDKQTDSAIPLDDHSEQNRKKPPNLVKHKRKDLFGSSDSYTSLTSEIQFDHLKFTEIIGGGGFGQVWRACWKGTPVAVKLLTTISPSEINKKTKESRCALEEFASEIRMLSGMRHPNICLYIGACMEGDNRCIVTELAANGSLWDALRQPLEYPYAAKNGAADGWPRELYEDQHQWESAQHLLLDPASLGTWPWILLKRVASGAARGMTYLHGGDPPVLHRDLKSANLLLDESYTTKVCDFGLSRLKADKRSMTGNCGTVQWMAPEVLANQRYAEPADVYSFGIILWELLTRECPYDAMNTIQCALAVLNKEERPEIPAWSPPAFTALIQACVAQDPKERPQFSQVISALDAMP